MNSTLPLLSLPENWEARVDPRSGRVYFFERDSLFCTWDEPEGFRLEAVWDDERPESDEEGVDDEEEEEDALDGEELDDMADPSWHETETRFGEDMVYRDPVPYAMGAGRDPGADARGG
jgi:hypothetical protein